MPNLEQVNPALAIQFFARCLGVRAGKERQGIFGLSYGSSDSLDRAGTGAGGAVMGHALGFQCLGPCRAGLLGGGSKVGAKVGLCS